MAKTAFNKKTLFTSHLHLNLRKTLLKGSIWGKVLYGAETWTLRKTDQKKLGSSEIRLLERDGEDQLDRSCEN
jgi:hypothetical protein